MGRRIAVGIGVVACLCASAAPAAADTATFGSNLQGAENLSILTSNGAMNFTTTTGVRMDAPANGVITSWAVRSGDLNSVYSIAVLRISAASAPCDTYTTCKWVVVSHARAPTAVPDSSDVVRTYTAPSIRIGGGDVIGLDNANSSLPIHQSGNPGDLLRIFSSSFGDAGTTLDAPSSSMGRELLLQATETYCQVLDVLHQKVAAAKQLLSTHDCTVSVKKKKVKKKRKKNKVLAESPRAGTIAPNDPVQLIVGKLKKPKK